MTYSPPIMKRKTTCVGLALDLLKRWHVLEKDFPGMVLATSVVSCEESVHDVRDYVMMGDGPYSVEFAEKEHVIVCTQVIIDGRPGVLLADPGYHLSKLITVMYDKMYPNTGWFYHPGDPNSNRDNAYGYNSWNSNYVEWRDRTDKGESVKSQTSLIYVAQPFLDAIHITEKRNLVYNLRSMVGRDAEGHLLAGLCFRVINNAERATFTLFMNNGVEKVKDKYSFYAFREPHNVDPDLLEKIEQCSVKMRYKKNKLLEIITKIAKIYMDQSFIDQMLKINDDIKRTKLSSAAE